MDTPTLKYEIIEWITNTQDHSLLRTLKSIKDLNASTQDWLSELSSSEIDSINRGIENHKNNDVMTSSEFWESHEK